MAIVTTYVCDVSGKSGTDKCDFIDVMIEAKQFSVFGSGFSNISKTDKRLIHIEVARKLNLVHLSKSEASADAAAPAPEPSFESKLKTLLHHWITEIAQEVVDNQ